MKKITTTLLFLCFAASVIYAQPKFPASTFPIGGFEISTLWPYDSPTQPWYKTILDSMNNIGFNTYYQSDYHDQLTLASHMPPSMTMYMGNNYYGGWNGPQYALEDHYVGGWVQGPQTVEKRYFLASPQSGDFDVETIEFKSFQSSVPSVSALADWKTVRGVGLATNEWKIFGFDGGDADGNLLKLELNNSGPWYHPGLRLYNYNGNTTMIADFIFRFDFTGQTVGEDDHLYQIDVSADGSSTPLFTFYLTKRMSEDSSNYGSHIHFNNGLNNRLSLFQFPTPWVPGNPVYAVVRINDINNGNNNINLSGHSKITFTLKRESGISVPIFVRGFRLRNLLADNILMNSDAPIIGASGHDFMDNQLQQYIFDKWKNGDMGTNCNGCNGLAGDQYKNTSVTPNIYPKDRVSSIASSGEATYEEFRTLAYIDKKWRDYSKKNFGKEKNIITFLALNLDRGQYAKYRTIYEDEIGEAPPQIAAEGLWDPYQKKGGSTEDPPFIPRDGIPHDIRHISGFSDMGFTLQPSNSSTDLASGYSAYTSNRLTSNGYSSITDNIHNKAAIATVPTQNGLRSKWYDMIVSTVQFDLGGNPFKPLDEPSLSSQTDLTTFRDNISNLIINSAGSTATTYGPGATLYAQDIYHQGYDISNILSSGTVSTNTYINTSTNHYDLRVRPPFIPEMRADAWNALAWGAKGIFFNEIGSDGGPNIGICDSRVDASYDYSGTGTTKNGIVNLTIGNCITPFFTADPNSTATHNYTERYIQYAGSDALPFDANSRRLSKFQRLPISIGGTPPNWVRVNQTDIDNYISTSSALVLNHDDGNVTTTTNWSTNPQAMPDPHSDNRFKSAGKWVPVLTGCPSQGYLISSANYGAGTIKIGSRNYTMEASLASSPDDNHPHVKIGTDVATSITNLVACINHASGAGSIYNCTTADPDVTASSSNFVSDTISVSLKLSSGTAFSVVTSSSCANVNWMEKTINAWASFFGGYPRDKDGRSIPYGCTADIWPYLPLPKPNNGMSLSISIPMFYGFKERWNGARQIVTDLSHCARTLQFLNWINTYSLPAVTANRQTDQILSNQFDLDSPFGNETVVSTKILSHKMDRTTFPLQVRSTVDNTDPELGIDDPGSWGNNGDRRLYELGFFSFKNIKYSQQKFAVVVNKRTWPYYYTHNNIGNPNGIKSTDNGDALLGAIDVRQFSATIDFSRSKWDLSNNVHPYRFTVIDYRNPCNPYYVTGIQRFTIPLDPGEGALLSITPGFSSAFKCYPTGGAIPSVVNNSRHISTLETGPNNQTFQMSHIKEGGVAVSYPVEGIVDSSMTKRHLGTPMDSLIDSNVHCKDPAICAHAEAPLQYAIVYSVDSSGTGSHHDSTSVIFRYASLASPYAYCAPIVLDKFKTPASNYIAATPAITPAKTGCGKYWVSWRNPMNGGNIALLSQTGSVINHKLLSAGDASSTRFISITSHLFRSGTESDTCYLAFEEGARASSSIYFLKAYCNTDSSIISTSELKNISLGIGNCENHYPNISVTPTHQVVVAWETIAQRYTFTDSSYALQRLHSIILRGRFLNAWTKTYLSLNGYNITVPVGTIDSSSSYPVFCMSDWKVSASSDTTWDDIGRLVYHNPIDEQAHISHYGYINGIFIKAFESVSMPDASLWPTLAERKMFNGILQPMMYTHPTYAEDTIYSPVVTVYDFPLSNLQKQSTLTQEIAVNPLSACGLVLKGDVGNISIRRDTLMVVANWTQRDTIIGDSIMPPQYNWSDSSLQTEKFILLPGDTLIYPRYFKLGNYQPGDTSALKSFLYNSSDYILMKVNLRSATNNSIIRTLDSCKLYSGGFVQSGNLTDSGISKTFNASSTGQVYMTFECTRGSSNNPFQVYNIEKYDYPTTIDEWPGPPFSPVDTSYKTSQPGSPKIAFSPLSNMTMTIHPNPFQTTTQVELQVPQEMTLNVTLFDLLGKPVTTLYNNFAKSSHYSFTLDSRQLHPGMYYVRAQAGSEVITRKIELIK